VASRACTVCQQSVDQAQVLIMSVPTPRVRPGRRISAHCGHPFRGWRRPCVGRIFAPYGQWPYRRSA
jgi:hypothetical protein